MAGSPEEGGGRLLPGEGVQPLGQGPGGQDRRPRPVQLRAARHQERDLAVTYPGDTLHQAVTTGGVYVRIS